LARNEGVTEELVSHVSDYESDLFAPPERAAIQYAELLAANHTAIDAGTFIELGQFFTEEQILELAWAAVSFIAYGRLIHSFGCTPKSAG
jgi:alkylhydroperoxidase family enzyme